MYASKPLFTQTGSAARLLKNRRVTLSSFARILLSRHCAVVFAGSVEFVASVTFVRLSFILEGAKGKANVNVHVAM